MVFHHQLHPRHMCVETAQRSLSGCHADMVEPPDETRVDRIDMECLCIDARDPIFRKLPFIDLDDDAFRPTEPSDPNDKRRFGGSGFDQIVPTTNPMGSPPTMRRGNCEGGLV